MMTPQLKASLNEVINHEARLSLVELEAMSRVQLMGWNGFKRLFKCRAKDRFKHLTYLKKCIVDYGHDNIPFSVEYMASSNDSTFSSVIGTIYKESEAHIIRLKAAMNIAFDEDSTMIAKKLSYMIKDQSRECLKLKRLLKSWENSQRMNDTSWLSRTDERMHEKYKRKDKKRS